MGASRPAGPPCTWWSPPELLCASAAEGRRAIFFGRSAPSASARDRHAGERRDHARPGLAVAVERGTLFRRPALDRARFGRQAADILITTPESLFLLLTSNARDRLISLDTIIVDEIHALVPGKRGAHLALSLERLEALRGNSGSRSCPGNHIT